MQLRRKQKEEQATEVQVIIYETTQTTAKAKEQGRQEAEEDHETQSHYWMDSRMADAAY
jgi:hypothetical protein